MDHLLFEIYNFDYLNGLRFAARTLSSIETPGDFKRNLNNIDVTFRKLHRSMVGPPATTDWSHPWHEILRDWNARVVQFVEQYLVNHWSVRCLAQHVLDLM